MTDSTPSPSGEPIVQDQPNVRYETNIPVPIEATWALLKDFGSWGQWCPLFENMRVINGKKGIGSIRKYKMVVGGYGYQEVLKELDDETTSLRYDNMSIHPAIPGVVGASITSTIVLTRIDAKTTNVVRSSWIKAQSISAEVLGMVRALQSKAYEKEIESLKVHVMAEEMIGRGMGLFNEKMMLMAKALLTGQAETWEYDEYPDWMGYLPKMVKGLPMSEVLPAHKIGAMLTRLIELVYLQAKQYLMQSMSPKDLMPHDLSLFQIESEELVKMGFSKPQGLAELTDYLIKHWDSDEEFCQQLLQGVNPLHIKTVEKVEEVPDVLRGLTITEKSGETKSVKQLVDEKRLFMLDYRELAHFNWVEPSYFYAPVMLVYRQIVDDNNSHLNVLGIQLHPSKSEVFTPDMPQKNRYKLAKMFVGCADTQYHEFRYHLCIAHMGMEPIVVATHNRLPKTHFLRDLLAPHLEGTIGIAFFARQTLIAEKEAFTDKTFALGTKQGLRLASDGWRKYDFFKSSFPEQLKARGFDEAGSDGVQNYHYRDDGFKFWNLIGEYMTDVVNKFYADDDAVLADGDLQMWADELAARECGAVPGFPSTIATKELLSQVLQIIIWNASAQHSVINYSQTPYLNLIPNRPNALYRPMPDLEEDKADLTEEYLKDALAPQFPMLFQLLFTWLLSLPPDTTFGNLATLKGVYDDDAKGDRFQQNLEKLSADLKARNEALIAADKAPYIYLLPENVACSVNI